jgi:threonine dehydratase
MLRVYDETGMLIEPSAAVAVAACLAGSGKNRIAFTAAAMRIPTH